MAISVDPLDVSQKLAAVQGLTFPLASDPTHAAIDAYGVLDVENEIARSAMFLVERDGTIARRFIGAHQLAPEELLRAIDRP